MTNQEKDEIAAKIGTQIPDDEVIDLLSSESVFNYLLKKMGATW